MFEVVCQAKMSNISQVLPPKREDLHLVLCDKSFGLSDGLLQWLFVLPFFLNF